MVLIVLVSSLISLPDSHFRSFLLSRPKLEAIPTEFLETRFITKRDLELSKIAFPNFRARKKKTEKRSKKAKAKMLDHKERFYLTLFCSRINDRVCV